MDAITLEVMRNRFFAITEEMGAALIRTAYSTNIKDRRDCSCKWRDDCTGRAYTCSFRSVALGSKGSFKAY